MSLKSNFKLMADYNQWINERVYRAASQLSADELSKDRGAFFGSIIGTLNHILVGDTIWLQRFAEHPAHFKALDYVRILDKPIALDSIMYAEFKDLESARATMDRVIKDFCDELSDEVLSTHLSYHNTKGDRFRKNFGHLVQHFFNHQTHHRGQVSTLLNQAGMNIGVTDLLVSIPGEG